MEGSPVISADILGSYAADAAREVTGVRGLVDGPRSRPRGARVSESDEGLSVRMHVAVEWGTDIPELGAAVQRRVAGYLGRMSGLPVRAVDVVVDEVAAPPEG
jgi:uncharacterized alkaline shock family protein YloU